MTDSTEERLDQARQDLANLGFDGPYTAPGPDMVAMVFGGSGVLQYAICLRCGAMVRLGDPAEIPGGLPVERSIALHYKWHEAHS